jgi:hypothetical protein
MSRRTIPGTPGVGYIYSDLLLFIDMYRRLAVLVKLSELKQPVVIQRWDWQKLPLNVLIVLLNYLTIYSE